MIFSVWGHGFYFKIVSVLIGKNLKWNTYLIFVECVCENGWVSVVSVWVLRVCKWMCGNVVSIECGWVCECTWVCEGECVRMCEYWVCVAVWVWVRMWIWGLNKCVWMYVGVWVLSVWVCECVCECVQGPSSSLLRESLKNVEAHPLSTPKGRKWLS